MWIGTGKITLLKLVGLFEHLSHLGVQVSEADFVTYISIWVKLKVEVVQELKWR